MRYTYTSKNYEIREGLKNQIERKFARLEKLLYDDSEIRVACSQTKQEYKLEVTIPLRRRQVRAEVTELDMFAAIDRISDKLEQQLTRYKDRLHDRSRRGEKRFDDEISGMPQGLAEAAPEEAIRIAKIKHFALKPMDAEEAVMEMEMLGHSFYMFRSASTEEVNVVYKRTDGSYGLIEPEHE